MSYQGATVSRNHITTDSKEFQGFELFKKKKRMEQDETVDVFVEVSGKENRIFEKKKFSKNVNS